MPKIKRLKSVKKEGLEAYLTNENTGIKLSLEDSQAFAQSLLNSPEPNQRMMAKAKEYKQATTLSAHGNHY